MPARGLRSMISRGMGRSSALMANLSRHFKLLPCIFEGREDEAAGAAAAAEIGHRRRGARAGQGGGRLLREAQGARLGEGVACLHVSNMSRAFRLARLLATQLRGTANALTSARRFSDATSRKVTVMAGSGDLAGGLRSGRPSYRAPLSLPVGRCAAQ